MFTLRTRGFSAIELVVIIGLMGAIFAVMFMATNPVVVGVIAASK